MDIKKAERREFDSIEFCLKVLVWSLSLCVVAVALLMLGVIATHVYQALGFEPRR